MESVNSTGRPISKGASVFDTLSILSVLVASPHVLSTTAGAF